jgi:drug/metabolite transporter (DMT)-like permease
MGDTRRAVLAAFLVSSILAGGNAVGVRFSNRELDPLWGSALRFGVSGVLLLGWVVVRRIPLPKGRAWTGPLVFGLFNYAIAFSLAYYGLVRVQAGFGQTILALMPLFTLLLAVAHRQERLTTSGIIGTLVAAGGVAVMSGPSLAEGVPLLSVLALVGAALSFGEAAVLAKRFPPVNPIAMNAIAMSAGAVVMATVSRLAGDEWALPELGETWLAIGYLVVVGSAVVFSLYLFVLAHWPASRAAYGLVIIPVVTFFLSVWLDDETLGPGLVAGAVLVLIGVYIGALRPSANRGAV